MQTIKTTIRLHRIQQLFRESPALYRGFVGGRGSGKTWAGAYDLIRRARSGRTYLIASPTGVLMQDTTYPTFQQIAKQLDRWPGPAHIRLSPYPTVTLTTGATVRFRTAEDPEKMRGPNLSGVWLDEASLMPHEAYLISIASLREQGQQGWLSATFTPKGRIHWTFNVFGREPPLPHVQLFHARTRDNPFNPPGFADHIRSQYTSAHADQELAGLFVDLSGAMFQRQWFGLVDAAPAGLTLVRRWDFAGSKPKPGRDPDWTAGVLLGRSAAGRYYVLDVRRTRDTAGGVELLVRQTAEMDGRAIPIRIEQEPGSSGLFVVDQFVRVVLPGWDCRGLPSSGDKAARARPLAAQAEAGNVALVRGPWNKDYLDEVETFPLGAHDDQVDASSGAFLDLTGTAPPGARIGLPPPERPPQGVFGATQGSVRNPPPGVFGR